MAAKAAPAVIALDPVFSRLPRVILDRFPHREHLDVEGVVDAIWEYGWRVIRAIAPLVPAVKINSAYFECCYSRGIEAYYDLIAEAKARGLLVIGDVKRGDVGHTAEMYAKAHLADADFPNMADYASPDAVTVSGYFGLDGVKPFIDVARVEGKGLFVLVRTSNESAAAIQDVAARDGRKLHEVVAAEVARWAADPAVVGENGYSLIGAVVATRDPADAVRLRAAMPQSIFLVPGYGAQGGRAEDFAPYFKPNGAGALIVAGRSVIFAYERPEYQTQCRLDWEKCVAQACADFVADLGRVAKSSV